MELNTFVLQNIFPNYLCNRNFLEKYNAKNLQDFAQTQLDFQFRLDNRYQNVNADGNPDLSLHCVLGVQLVAPFNESVKVLWPKSMVNFKSFSIIWPHNLL